MYRTMGENAIMTIGTTFLPTTAEELQGKAPDFVYVNGDAYVDHPSFGAAIITRVLESKGFTCAVKPFFRILNSVIL